MARFETLLRSDPLMMNDTYTVTELAAIKDTVPVIGTEGLFAWTPSGSLLNAMTSITTSRWQTNILPSSGHIVDCKISKDGVSDSAVGWVNADGQLYASFTATTGNQRWHTSGANVPAIAQPTYTWKMFRGNPGTGLGITTDGRMFSSGTNASGQAGRVGTNLVFGQVGTDADWSSIACGNLFYIGLKTDGSIWSWGINSNGRTGQGTTAGTTATPTQIGAGTTWTYVAANYQTAAAIDSDGAIWWTGNSVAPGTSQVNVMTKHPGANNSGFVHIDVSVTDAMWGIKTDGTLWGIALGGQGPGWQAICLNGKTHGGTAWQQVTSYPIRSFMFMSIAAGWAVVTQDNRLLLWTNSQNTGSLKAGFTNITRENFVCYVPDGARIEGDNTTVGVFV